MKQIKLFSNACLGDLENNVNEFLLKTPSKNVIDIKLNDSNGYFTAMVSYEIDNPVEDYHKYQLEWCKQHDITLEDIVAKAINCYTICEETNSTVEDIVDEVMEMIEEIGFNGECYACFNEWKDNRK